MTKVITKELVDLATAGENSQQVIETLAQRIDTTGRISNYEGYLQSVLDREELTSTAIGFGIAIPHGKSPHVKECTVAFGRLSQPVDWNSLDGKEVEMAFLLAVPEECAGDEHLKIIAGLSRKLVHEDFREMLRTSASEEEIVQVINDSLATVLN
ncbi:PTS sugar transporter subunit IIA [Enterococcus sp. 669A]|uniref:PTS sugar transporter subunit IIA n=1 Tax=Candidatus Enterococcus moelleringii TaxID=2815325 RepID=A0ABS3LEV5_9ENTE|nr:fructose PTS transporter subunit IIA [Enterococcus sp. 669A]MBO1308169.1 PTS sugar transporter subunit IIA [Enterococcus sp. 669A]